MSGPRTSSSLAELEGTKILCFPGPGLTAETAQGYSGQPVEVNGSSSGPVGAAENGWLPNLNMEGGAASLVFDDPVLVGLGLNIGHDLHLCLRYTVPAT